MPIGYLLTVFLAAIGTVFALAPAARPAPVAAMSYFAGLVVNELPFLLFAWLAASSALAAVQGDLDSPGGLVGLGVAALTTAGLAVVARRGQRAEPAVRRALDDGLGTGWRRSIDASRTAGLRRHLRYGTVLFRPFALGHRGVRRVANISYGDAGRRNLLDVYHHRARPSGGPVLVYLHGGGYHSGGKHREARALLHRLAAQGWVCVSANYRLRPSATFPDHLIDAKKVIAWAHAHGREYGADPDTVFVAGSSAGGHLAALAALSPGEPVFQPGFEHADTSVTAAISLYGYLGRYYGRGDDEVPPSTPHAWVHADAPPFFLTHGDLDPMVPVEGARSFADTLRRTSSSPVVYAELPGAHHAFDLFRSLRFEAVVDGIEAFGAWVLSRADRTGPAAQEPSGPGQRTPA